MNWFRGTMSGNGRTIIGPGAALNLNNVAPLNLNGRTLENRGTVLWTGPGYMSLISAVITNAPGALFDVQNAASLSPFTGLSRFDNAGTFRKSLAKLPPADSYLAGVTALLNTAV